jgi:hypothetical protein
MMPPCLGIDVSENEATSCDVESWAWRAHRGRAPARCQRASRLMNRTSPRGAVTDRPEAVSWLFARRTLNHVSPVELLTKGF